MIRPLFAQIFAPPKGARVGNALRSALEWWHRVLQLDLCERIPMREVRQPAIELFTDARGYPPRAAAVIFRDGDFAHTSMEVQAYILDSLIARADNQIMALELLGVALGLSTFVDMCRGRVVRCWVDNTGGESALIRCSAKRLDHNRIVHGVWAF